MSEEAENNEETPAEEAAPAEEQQAEEAAPEAAPEEAAPEEAPAEEPAVEEAEQDPAAAEDAPAEEAPAEQAEEPVAEDVPAEEPSEPEEALTPKQQRKRERSTHTGEARPQRGPDERAAERAERRQKAAESRRRARSRARQKHQPGEGTPPAERAAGSKKVRQGTVVSSKADKTITVRIEVVRRHPQYEKIVRQTATVHAHDEANDANEGDVVRVIESRPLSRTKRWRLVDVLERAR